MGSRETAFFMGPVLSSYYWLNNYV